MKKNGLKLARTTASARYPLEHLSLVELVVPCQYNPHLSWILLQHGPSTFYLLLKVTL